MAVCRSLHFQVVGDDVTGSKVLLDHYHAGRLFNVDDNLCNIQLSMFRDPSELTVSHDLVAVNGYIFLYNVEDQESFQRLNFWMRQIDMFDNKMSVYDENKVLVGNVCTSGQRVVELELVLAFAEFTDMEYFEAELAQNTIGAEKAISTLVRRIVHETDQATGKPTKSRRVHKSTVLQLFSRGRSSTTVVRTDPSVKHSAVSRNRSETISQYDNGDSKERNIFSSKEFEQLSEEIMKLNMTLATMSSLNLNTETSQQPVHNSDTAESPLARYSRVVTDANAHLKAAHDKIGSLRKASDDMITVLKKHIENEHENNDCLKAHNSELQQQLSDANDKHATVQKELDEATQRLRGSSNWIVDKAEVELTDKKLGVGGYGTVSVANFRGFQVAAKQLHGMILTSYNRSLFDREMNIASCVRHPNCVHFMGAVVDGEPIILMELLPAVLREILPRELNSLSDEQIPPICADVARALTYLHAMKPKAIIHRDVSSANVLVEPIARNLWRAKISDYGSANFLTKLRTNGPGNAVYAAPEACTPHLQSPKMDVFSFGVLVVEIYLREFPDPNNRDQMVHEVGLIYPKVVTIINKCLCIEPRNRWNMSQVLEQLNH